MTHSQAELVEELDNAREQLMRLGAWAADARKDGRWTPKQLETFEDIREAVLKVDDTLRSFEMAFIDRAVGAAVAPAVAALDAFHRAIDGDAEME